MKQLIDDIIKNSKNVDFDKSQGVEFCQEIFLAVSLSSVDMVQFYEKANFWTEYQSIEKEVIEQLKTIKVQFYFELKTLQLEKEGKLHHYPLKSIFFFFNKYNIDTTPAGIITRGFMAQPEVYKTLMLKEIL